MINILKRKYTFFIILFTLNYIGCNEHNKATSLSNTDKILQKDINIQKNNTNYYTLDSANVISNNKINYKVIVLEDKEKQYQDNTQHDNLLIVIQKQNSKGSYISYLKNEKLIFQLGSNCPADGFQRIISKNNYFTLEQIYCKDFMFTQSYTTFKINENGQVKLHRYGEDYTDRNNSDKVIKGISLTTKDFGSGVFFEKINSNFLRELNK